MLYLIQKRFYFCWTPLNLNWELSVSIRLSAVALHLVTIRSIKITIIMFHGKKKPFQPKIIAKLKGSEVREIEKRNCTLKTLPIPLAN